MPLTNLTPEEIEQIARDADAEYLARVVDERLGHKRVRSYKNTPIDYIDPAPKPFIVQIPLVEYFERIKRHKADKWQHDFCDRLQTACEGRHDHSSRAIVHAEAQLGKSSILAQCFPAWILGHDPLHRVALSTYNVTRSQSHSKAVIGIMNLPIHKQIFRDEKGWVSDKASKEKWQTTERLTKTTDAQESFNPVGLQSGLTGSGFDTLIIDDPYADQKEAFSETVRQNLQDFWEFTVMSRIGPHSNVFGMFHRYHVEDLAGYLLDSGGFDYWRYATICDGDYIHEETGRPYPDPLHRKIGEYISERRDEFYYREKRKNTRVFNSMFQGKPTSDEGDFFEVGKIATDNKDQVQIRQQECSVFVRSWDLASTDEGGDWSVGEKWGMSPDGRATLFNTARKQVESAGRDALMLATAKKDGYEVVISIPQDPGAAGLTAVFHIKQLLQGYTVVTRATSGSKEDRARPLASAVNSGKITFATDEDLDQEDQWLKAVKREFRNFPLSDHDDCVDSGADGYNECFERVAQGLVVKDFQIQNNLVLFDNFKEKFPYYLDGQNTFKIPKKWTVYAGMKITADATLPNSGIIVARPSENAELGECLFIVAEYKEYTSNFYKLFDWLDESLKLYCEKPETALLWLHKDSDSYAATIRQKLRYGLRLFKEDNLAGLTEVGWYLKSRDKDHPFYSFGQSSGLYALIADANQLAVATDDGGLVSLRQEAATWRFNDKQEPNATGAVWECLRMIAYEFRTRMVRKTIEEQIDELVPEGVKLAAKTAMTATEKLCAYQDLEFQREFAAEKLRPAEDEWSEFE